MAKPNSKPPNKEVPPQVCILTVELLIAVTFRILWNFSVDFFLILEVVGCSVSVFVMYVC